MLVLGVGALGIVFGAGQRLSSWSGASADGPGDDDGAPLPEETVRRDPPVGPTASDTRPAGPDPRVEMQARYRPGPFLQVESMVPSGRLLPAQLPTDVLSGRTLDNPWIVPGAELRPGSAPSSSPGGPTVVHDPGENVGRPLTVLARTPARALVRAEDAGGGTDVAGYLVEMVGYQGHFYLPATVPTELGVVQAGGSDGAMIQFAIQTPIRPDGTSPPPGQSFEVTMRIGAVDTAGRVSSLISRPLLVMAVGAGDVEVTLTMEKPTDLDLYVIDPAGVTIYFQNQSAFSGGRLDLDANAACSSNVGVNNEHVFWPRGSAPVGTYRVHVAHYESCIQNRPLDYRVTVVACGETVVVAGRFEGGANSQVCSNPGPADRGWCQQVLTFDVPPCPGVP